MPLSEDATARTTALLEEHHGVVNLDSALPQVAQWRREAVASLKRPSLVGGSIASGNPQDIPRSRQTHQRNSGVWSSIRSVDWRDCENRHEEAEVERFAAGRFELWWWYMQGWVLALLVGVCTAFSGVFIEYLVNFLSSPRFGYCQEGWWLTAKTCPKDHWRWWNCPKNVPDSTCLSLPVLDFAMNLGLGLLYAFISAMAVHHFAPAASGSGIPEVKTILNGFVMPDVVSLRTLAVKVPGLALSVSSGMALGKEGPLIHVAVCWAQLLSHLFPQFKNEQKRRELFSAAAAAGVSTAFGAPLGGVLFSLEEVSSTFPSRTLLRCFTAAMCAALSLSFVKGSSDRLTLFSVEYNQPCKRWEYIYFAILGVLGGLVGASFNFLNVRWSQIRAKPEFRSKIHRVTEVTAICFITLLMSYWSPICKPLSSDAINAMFRGCNTTAQGVDERVIFGFCADGEKALPTGDLLYQLALAAVLRQIQLTLTFGTACPAGLFVPSLFVGACLGRFVGTVAWIFSGEEPELHPGVYAMVGAASVLGGICRVTISLVAIMLELTGGMTYIVPFMIAVLISKLVGDLFNNGIYDLYIVLRGYPFLAEELDVTFTERCCDIMETGLTTVDMSAQPRVADLRWMMESYPYRGFPVTNGDHFLGYVKKTALEELCASLDERARERGDAEYGNLVLLKDLLPITDQTVMRMVPDASLSQVHKVFKQLGCKYVFLVGSRDASQDVLAGIISKKNFLRFLKNGKVGHMANHPAILPAYPPSNWSGRRVQNAGRLPQWRQDPSPPQRSISGTVEPNGIERTESAGSHRSGPASGVSLQVWRHTSEGSISSGEDSVSASGSPQGSQTTQRLELSRARA